MDIKKFGKYKEGLTAEEIKVYLRERLNEMDQFNTYKKCPVDVVKRFNKAAGCNTMACKVINDKMTTLMYRCDVERFADLIFCGKSTYFD
jgi:hypothetical protein